MDFRHLITTVLFVAVFGNTFCISISGGKYLEYKRPVKKIVLKPGETTLLERLRAVLGTPVDDAEVIHKRNIRSDNTEHVAFIEKLADKTRDRHLRMVVPGNRVGKQSLNTQILMIKTLKTGED